MTIIKRAISVKFRYDINGLRAIAVCAVVLFHFLPSTLSGGFAGVDVFFVISGYLMTRIIFNGLEKNNFSLLNFYKSRIIRIIPAASILFIILFILGWLLLIPKEYANLAKHIADSSVFISNFSYMKELGYFDTGAHEKWLLHTWSLAIEWQFYLVYPVILIIINKFFKLKVTKLTVLFMFFISLLFCIYTSSVSPEKAYFSFYARIWEMLAGGIVFLFFQRDRDNRNLSILGFMLVFISYFVYSDKTIWPSYNAILPVFGAFLILIANNQSSVIYNNIVSQSIGKWSYSIYLWHWPIAVYLHMSPYASDVIAAIFGMCVSVFLGYLSFRYIESFDFKKYKYGYSYPLLMVLIIFLAGKTISHYDGYNNNYNLVHTFEEKLKYERYCHIDDKSNNRDNLNCKIGEAKTAPKGILWGDSYAGHLDPFLSDILPDNVSFISRTVSGCYPAFTVKSSSMVDETSKVCEKARSITKKEILSNPYNIIFIAGRWDLAYKNDGEESIEAIKNTIKVASENSKMVYVFAQPVLYKNLVMNTYLRHKVSPLFSGELIRNDSLPKQLNIEIEQYIHRAGLKNVIFVDRKVLYGSELGDDLTSENLPYTYDGGHLSEYGAKAAAKNFKESTLYNQFMKQLTE
ncbi:acyltransferase family protein [Providencia sp.]